MKGYRLQLRDTNALERIAQVNRRLFSSPTEGASDHSHSPTTLVAAAPTNKRTRTYLDRRIDLERSFFVFFENVQLRNMLNLFVILLGGKQPSFPESSIFVTRDSITFEALPKRFHGLVIIPLGLDRFIFGTWPRPII